jgi:hypothetical protein
LDREVAARAEACRPDQPLKGAHGDEEEKKERPPCVVFCAAVPSWADGGGDVAVEAGLAGEERAVGMLKADVDIPGQGG